MLSDANQEPKNMTVVDPSRFKDCPVCTDKSCTIGEYEERLIHTDEKDEKIDIIKALAKSYTTHLLMTPEFNNPGGETKDMIRVLRPTLMRILQLYDEAYLLGDLYSLYMHGSLLVLFYSSVNTALYTQGVAELCSSWAQGYTYAKECLEDFIEDGVIKGFESADDLLKVYGESLN